MHLDLSCNRSQPEPQVYCEAQVYLDELIEELWDRVAFLERAPERRSVEAERYQQIVAGLMQTNN